ncbi:hypothetical protein Vadar_010766 [Vaccinium darrowii]|uniref:Uncharacterized protein n=1 Tax=Vaccinium darrowii TaxID=229202 RepID=A0ACB7XGQ9_9ERIC|nr:hypothetical protein Vadar_010766 [Vaccinium darrowii]
MEPGNVGQHESEGSSQQAQTAIGTRDIDKVLASMAQQSEQQVEFMLSQTQQAIAAVSGIGLLEKFKNLFTTRFEGSVNPIDAENLLRGVERVLVAMRPLVPQVITWERFVNAFNNQYFPEAYRFEQEAAFVTLEQEKEKMTIPEYEAKFSALSRYASDLVDTNEKKCRRFKAGLETNVRTRLISYKQENFADLVDVGRKVGKDVEQMLKREQFKKSKSEAGQASQASKSGAYYKSGSKFQHLKGQSDSKQQSGQRQVASRPSIGRGGSSSGRGTPFQCYRCG